MPKPLNRIILSSTIIIMLLNFCTTAQESFLIRTPFGLRSAVLSSLDIVNDTIQCMGFVTEYNQPSKISSIFARYTLGGDSIDSHVIKLLEEDLMAQQHGFSKKRNSLKFLTRTIDTSNFKYVTINNFDFQTKEIDQKLFNGFYETTEAKFPEASNLPLGAFTNNDKYYIFYETRTSPINARNQIGLIILNDQDSLLDHVVIGNSALNNIIYSVHQYEEGFVIGGAIYNDRVNFVNDVIYQSELHFIDFEGNIHGSWKDPDNNIQQGVKGVVKTPDEGFVIATCQGSAYEFGSWNPPRFRFKWRDGLIYKLDSNLNEIWRTVIPGVDTLRSDSYVEDLVALPDGSGFVMSGQVDNLDIGPVGDTFYLGFDTQGWLVKVSPEGDSLWERRIAPVDPPWNWHVFYDVEPTPDGGVVAVGMSIDMDETVQPQQAWIVKTDEYGCIVPGCQYVATEDLPSTSERQSIKIYPNPVSDMLAIYTDNIPGDKIDYVLYSMDGQQVKSFEATTAMTTYLLPVHDLAASTYILNATDGGRLIGSEKVVVQR